MLTRQFKTFQVKCNFCLEWMSLGTELKFTIHVCDGCLHKVLTEKSLQALSSSGEIYQIHMLDQTRNPVKENMQNSTQTEFQQERPKPQDIMKDFYTIQTQETAFNFNSDKENAIQELKSKWNIIQSFINQKDFLTTEETAYLKILLSQNPQKLPTLSLLQPRNVSYTDFVPELTSQFENQQNSLKIFGFKENDASGQVSNFDQLRINVKTVNQQKQQNSLKKTLKPKEKTLKGKENLNLRSPVKGALTEWDLNRNSLTTCKLAAVQQNLKTSTKRLKTSFFEQFSSPTSSRLSSLTVPAQGSPRSAFGSSFLNSISQGVNWEQTKRFDQVKNKILKYLQKNYDSQPLSRLMLSIVMEAYKNTRVQGKNLELVSYNLSYVDFKCYLESFDWTAIEILKLVNTKLSDDQLKTLVEFMIAKDLGIKVLVLTGNRLSQRAIQVLSEVDLPSVRQIYLGKNHICRGKVRVQTFALQNKYSLYM